MSGKKRGFFSSHSKSSAAVVSVAIHAVFVVIALTFVAVKVIQKEDQDFQAKPVHRPKMKLKKLQVPINVKKKKVQKPKLRKRIVVNPKINKNMPDIKMPEITGVKGGLGSGAGDGLGAGGGIGFSMPEIEIFGIKGKGEKVVLILGSNAEIMDDRLGGIPAYTIIKSELIRIVEELPPTALFDVIVYDWKTCALAFPDLAPANAANAKKLKEWLMPLNAVRKGMGDRDFGLHTIGPGGSPTTEKLVAGKFKDPKKVKAITDDVDVREWYRAVMLAHKMQADSIFVLTETWGLQRVSTTGAGMSRKEWDLTSAGKKWKECHQKGLAMLDAENKKRRAAGQAPKALNRNEWDVNREYFPDIERPPQGSWYHYTPKDFAEAFVLLRQEYRPVRDKLTAGLSRRKKGKLDFSFNVIQFVPKGEQAGENDSGKFKTLTHLCGGAYKTIAGMDEIKSYVTAE